MSSFFSKTPGEFFVFDTQVSVFFVVVDTPGGFFAFDMLSKFFAVDTPDEFFAADALGK